MLIGFYHVEDKDGLRLHVYGDVGSEWHYQPSATEKMRNGARPDPIPAARAAAERNDE